jgi:hypothetical protein
MQKYERRKILDYDLDQSSRTGGLVAEETRAVRPQHQEPNEQWIRHRD